MPTTSKILATIVLIFVFLILNGLIQADSDPGGRNPGIFGIIFLVGLIAAIRAVWKKPKTDIIDEADNTDLNKD